MIQPSTPSGNDAAEQHAQAGRVEELVSRGPHGAIAVAGTATVIVIALWFAFYFLVFLPRGVIQ